MVYKFRLSVTALTSNSQRAISNLEARIISNLSDRQKVRTSLALLPPPRAPIVA